MTQNIQTHSDFSPISLRYVASLRGVVSPKAGTPFTYVATGDFDPHTLANLAASNPEGRFYGVCSNEQQCNAQNDAAKKNKQTNLSFTNSLDQLPRQADFFCSFTKDGQPSEAIFAKAQSILSPSGIFALRYQAYNNANDILSFLAQEYAPEFSKDKETHFLDHIAKLGARFFHKNPQHNTALQNAIASGNATQFCETLTSNGEVTSGSFATLAGLLPRGFAFAGDANVGTNYLELMAPKEAHETLTNCQSPLLYEPMKDFALMRTTRNDVWVKTPVEQSLEGSQVFGSTIFGMTTSRENLPKQIETAGGKTIDLTTPLFSNLIELMDTLPLSIGDFLSHPLGKNQDPDEVLAALQILVACGIAQPMRSRYESEVTIDLSQPLPAGMISTFLDTAQIGSQKVQIPSTIMGRPMILSAREALVLQAVSRVGLGNSAGALFQELEKLKQNNPTLFQQIANGQSLTHEMAEQMVQNVIKSSILKWYAYGLLAA